MAKFLAHGRCAINICETKMFVANLVLNLTCTVFKIDSQRNFSRPFSIQFQRPLLLNSQTFGGNLFKMQILELQAPRDSDWVGFRVAFRNLRF